jgi:hypothetical protein
LSYIIESTLRIKPETGLYLKVEQIKNYVSYRLQHIENLVKPMAEMMMAGGAGREGVDGRIGDLEMLRTMANRLAGYLGELVK